ncbi:hypothetical protein K474DRAFT_882485 [Panus rudis PR-1116 ss-1]|nr:hypothetical protein K474DRAFT_882485 [Panus rudis PR-1116 ss-1]
MMENSFNSIITLQNNPINWGLAAFYAFRAYNDNFFLNMSTTIWNEAFAFFITPEDAALGKHPTKNASIQSQCLGASTAGGVFYQTLKPNDTVVNGATVAGFLVLSAYLFELTENATYSSAAGLSAQFILSHMYDGRFIKDGIDVGTCTLADLVITDNSGFTIEGLSVYSNVTGNTTMLGIAKNLTATAIKFDEWTDESGILHEGVEDPESMNQNINRWGLKSLFIRGLYEAWRRSPPDSDVANLIQSYITVQYNALLDFSRTPGGHFYSPVWRPPPASHLLPWGQLAAIDVMNSAIDLPVSNDTATTSSFISSTASSSPTSLTQNSSWASLSHPLIRTPIDSIFGAFGAIAGHLLVVTILLCAY